MLQGILTVWRRPKAVRRVRHADKIACPNWLLSDMVVSGQDQQLRKIRRSGALTLLINLSAREGPRADIPKLVCNFRAIEAAIGILPNSTRTRPHYM